MYLKDHYKTLNLEPSASEIDIKKAFRRLAQQYHPDKNNNDPYAEANFNEIKEAYETLTNPAKKESYLQQRWYNRTTGNSKTAGLITPVYILTESLEFERYTSTLDVFRMDRNGLFEYMNELLSDHTINKLLSFNEPDINRQIIKTLLKPTGFLSHRNALLIAERMDKLAADDISILKEIKNCIQQIKKKEKWQRYKWILILIVTASLCLLIKFASS